MAQVWDGVYLKLTFRRCVDNAGFECWIQLVDLVKSSHLSDEADSPIWTLEANGVYSAKSFYKQINFWDVVSDIGDKPWKVL